MTLLGFFAFMALLAFFAHKVIKFKSGLFICLSSRALLRGFCTDSECLGFVNCFLR